MQQVEVELEVGRAKLGIGRRHTSAEKKQECTFGEKVHQMGMKRQPLPIHLGVNANLLTLANNSIGQLCGMNCTSHTPAQDEPCRFLVVYLPIYFFLNLPCARQLLVCRHRHVSANPPETLMLQVHTARKLSGC
jgi:hypothetical protein